MRQALAGNKPQGRRCAARASARRCDNNADLLRLITVCAVTWGHAYALACPSKAMPVSRLLGFDCSGLLATMLLFVLNGLPALNSGIGNPSAAHRMCARAFRLFLAPVIRAAASLLVLRLLLTGLPPRTCSASS
ncbi:hypothetical protein E0493_09355 [Roseomonas sp. M0104]|uniref:Acyltransferase n=1 Tax=Teichococcus coralli TaxID=2545983 RepID=A0A845B9V4_9PROT|nr:hypothetical protein [Pseudoroseomonas coralli]MXP63555.1 hypothetical protein [Pseudoroseomonas coralli]